MDSPMPELLVTAGVLRGRRFAVPEAGLRLGRSSSCEMSVSDPALSRNHCLFEFREGALWITDLASANGTLVNGSELGDESRRLEPGDMILAGDTEIKVVPAGTSETDTATVDLGLGGGEAESVPEEDAVRPNVMRLVLWAAAGAAVLVAAYMIVGAPPPEEPQHTQQQPAVAEEPLNSGKLVGVAFEKVQASPEGICRFELSYGADGALSAVIDDQPVANRHVEKSVRLTADKVERLDRMLKDSALYALDPSYAGAALRQGEMKSIRLKVVRMTGVFGTYVENVPEPDALRAAREQLEAFAKNELGIWGIDKSVDELKSMSAEARRSGDAKWDERDVQHGNLAQAIAAYDEAVMLLETVNPKPDGYDALVQRIREAKAELDRRYREQCFRADKAINLKDWATALDELRTLCDLVPDDRDPRHAEANAKLLDVEARQKGGRK